MYVCKFVCSYVIDEMEVYVWCESNLFGHGSELRWHDEDVRAHTFQFPVLRVAQIILRIDNDTLLVTASSLHIK